MRDEECVLNEAAPESVDKVTAAPSLPVYGDYLLPLYVEKICASLNKTHPCSALSSAMSQARHGL